MKKLFPICVVMVILVASALMVYFSFDILLHKMRHPCEGKTVYFVPYRGAPESEEEFVARDSLLFFSELKAAFAERGYTLKYSTLERTPRDADYLVVINRKRSKRAMRRVAAFPKNRKIALIFEPPIIEPKAFSEKFANQFAAIYYLTDQQIDGITRRKLHFPHHLRPLDAWSDFDEKQLCTLIVGNKSSDFANSLYSERRSAIDFFEAHHPGSFAFYGRGWQAEEHPTYLGEVDDKLEAMSHYRFSICYENSVDLGNLTEKIFDSLCAGCVPVYWGAPDITKYVPKECFVDRTEFESLEELYSYLSAMEREEYEGYLAAIRTFLASEQAAVRSVNSFADEVVSAVEAL